MAELKLCRICLCKNMKVYNYESFNLKQYYEQVMDIKVNYKDDLPHYFCYMCATMLYKFHKFKEKCQTGQKALKGLLRNGPLTLRSISKIDRKNKKLKSSIDFMDASKRVKTYSNTHKPPVKAVFIDTGNLVDRQLVAAIKKEISDKEDIVDDVQMQDDINEFNVAEKVFSDIEDGIPSGDDDDVFDSRSVMNVDETFIKEDKISDEEIIDEEKIDQSIILNEDHKMIVKQAKKETKQNKAKRKKGCAKEKANKFIVIGKTSKDLDPKHWLKINLTEEEALEELKTKAQEPKFLAAVYKCTGCVKIFSREDILNRHIKLKHSESLGPVECRFCKMRFKWTCFLNRHITQHYKRFKCLRCDVTCPLLSTALFHNDYHNGVKRKCKYCEKEFRHVTTFYTHLRTHRSEHVCTLCGASFVSNNGLLQHKRTMHIDTVVNPAEEVNTHCNRCDIMFETQKAYEEHMFHSAKHSEGFEDYGNQSSAAPRKGMKKGYHNPRNLTTCAICKKTFSTQAAYLRHHEAKHKDVPKDVQRHICQICGALLKVTSVANHLNTHTREKLFNCTTCGMQFNCKGSLKRHQLTHTGEKPFECTLCDKRFTQKGSMNLHYRTIHLKEPQPKRNRRKKQQEPQVTPVLEIYKNDNSEDS